MEREHNNYIVRNGRFFLLAILAIIVLNFISVSYAKTDSIVEDTKVDAVKDTKKKDIQNENTVSNKSEEKNIVKTTDKNNTSINVEEKKNSDDTNNATNTTNKNNIPNSKSVEKKKEKVGNNSDKLEVSKIETNNVGASVEKGNLEGTITEIRSESNGYIIGNIRTNVKLDGKKLLVVDEDGKKYETWVVSSGNNNYYFDKNMSGMSKDKKYHFEIVIGNESVKVSAPNKNLGYVGVYNVSIKNGGGTNIY